MKRSFTIILIAITFCIVALIATAPIIKDTPGMAGPGDPDRELQGNTASDFPVNKSGFPPGEAIAACTGKSSGEVCQFTDRTVISSGICDDKPGVLACAPAGGKNTGQPAKGRSASPNATPGPGIALISAAQTIPAAMGTGDGTFTLTSTAGADGGTMLAEYTCDGASASPALSWSGAPEGTKEYALMMTTIPVDGSTRRNWVLYGIPGTTTHLGRNTSGVGILGTGSHGTVMMYDTPCPQGPGAKVYTYTMYALSGSPSLPSDTSHVTGPVLTDAISSITLAKASFNLSYARAG